MSKCIDFRGITAKLLESRPEENIFLLLDHGGLPGLSKQLQYGSTEWMSLFDRTKEESALAVAPILVLAASGGEIRLSRIVFDWLKQRGTYSSSVMMLVSSLDLTGLARGLGTRLHITLAGGVEAMLRFFDPRVFESLLNILTREQKEVFLGVASSWHYVDRSGRIAQTTNKYGAVNPASKPVLLSQEQEDHMLAASEIDQILSSLRSSVPNLFSEIPRESQYDFVSESVIEARSKKLGSVLQMSLYAMIRLFYVKGIMSMEVYEKAIEYLRSSDVNNLKILLNNGEVNI
ncbi:DUF4123 domain-containing protein [Massilia sp. CFBP9012]|uniref:DUF4123 domain-containing protein n=1 Tax=Massilia sp. CFBP9012 TaxID=3096531 RepID=UPI002A6B70E6|nr:DUF4123 domain-containing protein [Massilia sp. CFBP9012]MDY0977924.1 DUF4123 domain-containing protein [Massilia sp. CFBP9012]